MKIIPQITYKSVLKGIKDIKKRNEAFHALDKQSQRMEIAWDMLQLVINGVIFPAFGEYWDYNLHYKAKMCDTGEELQKLLNGNDNIERCEVCQRGGIMLSTIRLGNTVSPNDNYKDRGSAENIQAFSMDDMNTMEEEYENSEYGHPYDYHTSEKLANICCNILVNGNFNPKDDTDYLIVKY